MVQNYQISLEEQRTQELIHDQPGRTAFIDECGCFGFDFSKDGVSEYYILCAVIVEDGKIDDLRDKVLKVKLENGLKNTEMKSSKVGSDDVRRTRIVKDLLDIDFRVILFVADKKAFIKSSPLTEYKTSFIKHLHQRLYNVLYHAFPKLKIIEDETGTTDFQESFKKYVKAHRPEFNLFNEYDFDYSDSKDELLIQLADFVGGSINRAFVAPSAPNYLEMLRAKIMDEVHFPSKNEPYWGSVTPESCKFDKDIYALALKCANDFVDKYESDDEEETRLQVAFLKYLLYNVQNVSPTGFVSSNTLISVLRGYSREIKVTKNYLYRRVVAPLRDKGIIISSSSHGYKIPISSEDITVYLNQTHSIVSPMLHRIGVCRTLIKEQTSNSLDVLDDSAFLKYKKYFD